MKFINIDHILWHPKIVNSLPKTSVKRPMPALIYKLTPLLSTNISNFVKFANNLDVDIF